MVRYVDMDNETIWPHWDCPNCDALNIGVERCHPRYPAWCDECGTELKYDWAADGPVSWIPAFLVTEEDE